VAVTPDGSNVYVANEASTTVSVIATASNTVTATIPVGVQPFGVAVTPDGSKVYVANIGSGSVSVIATASNTVTATINDPVGAPAGVAVTPDGSKVYVANDDGSLTVSVIATATNTLIGSPIPVGGSPTAFGIFIQAQSALRFAGTPGRSNCYGQSVSALARQYHGLNAAAAALEFTSVGALQNAILAFCG
jgi:YVTN family beta-propeller protein